MKNRLANSLASGNTSAALNILRGIATGAGIEAATGEDNSESAAPLPYNQARAQKQ